MVIRFDLEPVKSQVNGLAAMEQKKLLGSFFVSTR
jgi:hypothetical protein